MVFSPIIIIITHFLPDIPADAISAVSTGEWDAAHDQRPSREMTDSVDRSSIKLDDLTTRPPSTHPPGHHEEAKPSPFPSRTTDGASDIHPLTEDNDLTTTMSRQPLLLRSSPALGTASSYGGILLTDPDRLADEDATDKYKNSHRGEILRRVISLGDEEPYGSERSRGPGRTSFQSEGTSRRRKSISGFGALAQDIRFGSGGLPAIGALRQSSKIPHSTDSDADDEDSSDHISIDVHDEYPADDSPYAQVRASVSPYDDTTLSINTPRMWFFCILFAIFGSSTNLFFSLRYPSVSITPVIALLVVHPFGLLWDQIFKRDKDPEQIFVQGSVAGSSRTSSPHRIYSRSDAARASWRRRLRLWLGQGRWNEKEHCCVFISSNVSFGFAFATDVSSYGMYRLSLGQIC